MKQQKGFRTGGGCFELISDDGEMKINIRQRRVFSDSEISAKTIYTVFYFVREGLEWQRMENEEHAKSPEEVFEYLKNSGQFWKALADILDN